MLFEFIIIFILLFIIFGLVYQFMFDIWIETLIICIVFFVSYVTVKIVLHNRKKQAFEPITESKQVFQPKTEDPAMKTLKPFISKNINEGFKGSVIKEALLKQGWPKEKIDQAFRELNL